MSSSNLCPCGSGKLRRTCEPVALAMCSTDGCGRWFHQRSNSARYCEPCRLVRRREQGRARSASFRERHREEETSS